MDDKVTVGKIRTSHGVKGFLKVMSYSEEYEHFKELKTVELRKGKRSKVFEVEQVTGSGPATLIKLKGIDDPETGKLYANFEIWVDSDKSARCEEGEFYQSDLIGCSLVFENSKVGEVLSILGGGAHDLLEVKKEAEDKVILVPFQEEFIGDVNIADKTIEIKVEWILD